MATKFVSNGGTLYLGIANIGPLGLVTRDEEQIKVLRAHPDFGRDFHEEMPLTDGVSDGASAGEDADAVLVDCPPLVEPVGGPEDLDKERAALEEQEKLRKEAEEASAEASKPEPRRPGRPKKAGH